MVISDHKNVVAALAVAMVVAVVSYSIADTNTKRKFLNNKYVSDASVPIALILAMNMSLSHAIISAVMVPLAIVMLLYFFYGH
jgi:hypothetical protein